MPRRRRGPYHGDERGFPEQHRLVRGEGGRCYRAASPCKLQAHRERRSNNAELYHFSPHPRRLRRGDGGALLALAGASVSATNCAPVPARALRMALLGPCAHPSLFRPPTVSLPRDTHRHVHLQRRPRRRRRRSRRALRLLPPRLRRRPPLQPRGGGARRLRPRPERLEPRRGGRGGVSGQLGARGVRGGHRGDVPARPAAVGAGAARRHSPGWDRGHGAGTRGPPGSVPLSVRHALRLADANCVPPQDFTMRNGTALLDGGCVHSYQAAHADVSRASLAQCIAGPFGTGGAISSARAPSLCVSACSLRTRLRALDLPACSARPATNSAWPRSLLPPTTTVHSQMSLRT